MTDPIQPPRPAPAPWGIWATLGWALLAVIVAQFVSLVALAAYRPDLSIADSKNDGILIILTTVVATPIQIGMLMLAARLGGWRAEDYFALRLPRRADVVVGVGALVLVIAVFDLMLALTGRDLVPPFQVEVYRTAQQAGWLTWLWLTIVVIGPIGEEIVFRGFLFRGWARDGRSVYPAILATAAAWALLHVQYDWLGIVQIFAIGLLLGWLRWVSGSTILVILIHALANFESMIETVIRMEWLGP